MNSAPRPATDDRPFPYLRGRTIPSVYLLTITLILLASVVFVRLAGGGLRRLRRHSDLFAMGAAFLLLETKSVVQFALLFGTTWLVNALVFAGVLTAVLVAIELTRHFRFSHPGPLYGLLLASLAVAFVVPQQRLLELTFWPRFGAAAALAFTPILLANLIFAERFRRTESSAEGFGANLLGAMVGGVLEYTALMSGYRILLLLVGALYVGAFFLGRRRLLAA